MAPPPPAVTAAPPAPMTPAPTAAAPALERPANQKTGCLSVNAKPFATVYVDGRAVGATPHACLRVSIGRHRLVFESMDERSPEEIVVVGDEHTAEAPLSVSYDFRARQFVAR